MRVAIAALAAAALAGCSGGPYPEQEKQLRADMVRHFAQLNAEAGLLGQRAKATKTDIDLPPSALVLTTYDWDIAGNIYPNVVCPNAACGVQLGTKASAGTTLRCPACNTDLMEELTRIGRGQPMFDIKSGNALPIVVLVRYVRHTMAYDPNSAVSVSSKVEAAHQIEPLTKSDVRGTGYYYAGGFYRTATSALCTTAFVYKGGELRQVHPDQVKKMTADPPENVPVSSMKLGRWGAVEVPLTPWLGRPPSAVSAPKEAPKSP